jgi:hypothetical protein
LEWERIERQFCWNRLFRCCRNVKVTITLYIFRSLHGYWFSSSLCIFPLSRIRFILIYFESHQRTEKYAFPSFKKKSHVLNFWLKKGAPWIPSPTSILKLYV